MPSTAPSVFDSFGSFDAAAAAWVRAHSTPGLAQVMDGVSLLHSQVILWAFAIVFAYLTYRRGEPRWSALTVIVVAGGLILNALLKLAFARARPSIEDVHVIYDTYSFPSGHAAGSTLVYGFLAAYVSRHATRRWVRVVAWVAAAAMVVLVALSRLVLGAHFASDVSAGIAWAALWVAAWVWAFAPPRKRLSEESS